MKQPAAIVALLAVAGTVAVAGGAHAQPHTYGPDLVVNGYFDQTTTGVAGQYYTGTGTAPAGVDEAVGWNACATAACNNADGGYPFLFIATPGVADGKAQNATNGFADPWDDKAGHGNNAQGTAYRALWGAANGGVGLDGKAADAFNGYGPTGAGDTHNFLIADGGYHPTTIFQTVTGLIAGYRYTVEFDWAAGQWSLNSGTTTEKWQVGLGNQYFDTSTIDLNSHGFSGWMQSSFTFTATSSSEPLSFLAMGTPAGNPPMLLLDDVALYSAPEPAAWAVMAAGIVGVAFAGRRRRQA